MATTFKLSVILSIIVSLLIPTHKALADDFISLDNYFAMPLISGPKLSPDGNHIVTITPDGNLQSVVIAKFGERQFAPIVKLKEEDDRIESIYWLNNDKLLISSSFVETFRGQKVRLNRLYTINKNGADLQLLQVPRKLRPQYLSFSGVGIVSVLRDDPEHILVQAYTTIDNYPAVFKVNINDGEFEKHSSSVKGVRSWLANRKGEIKVGVKNKFNRATKTSEVSILVRNDISSNDWDTIYSYEAGESYFLKLHTFVDDETVLVSTDFGEYQNVLREFSLKDKEFGKLVYKVEGYDLDTVLVENDTVVGVSYIDDFYQIEYFDPELKSLQDELKAIFPQYMVYLSSASANYNRLIAGLASENSPTKFYLVDLDKGSAQPWLSTHPKLEGHDLPAKQKFTFKAQDDTELSGYLTMGPGYSDSPLVVFPHGGPNARDTQAFDSWVQMLARRGYAVLQVNFRGSAGFGNSFELAGYKEWGKLMQQDIYDAVAFIGENQLADTTRACIVGASYGGYVALTAGFQKPDMFDCIASINGVSDLPELIAKDNEWGGSLKQYRKDQIGDTDVPEELADLEKNSAINYINSFKVPVLLIHGEYDSRVHYEQSEVFYEQMKVAGKDVQYLLLERGTHFVDTAEHREKAFIAIDKFLAKHLGESK